MKDKVSFRCRLCLSTDEQEEYSSVFNKHRLETLAKIIQLCFGIKIRKSDGITQDICNSCRMEIIHFYDVRKRCLASDTILHTERNHQRKLQSSVPLKQREAVQSSATKPRDEIPNNVTRPSEEIPRQTAKPKEEILITIESFAYEPDHEQDTPTGEPIHEVLEDDSVEPEAELSDNNLQPPVEEIHPETDELEIMICGGMPEMPEEGSFISKSRTELNENSEEIMEESVEEFLQDTDEVQVLHSDEDSELLTDAQSQSQSEAYANAASEVQTLSSDEDSDMFFDNQHSFQPEPDTEEPDDVPRFVCCGCRGNEFNSQEELDAHRLERHQRYRIPNCLIRPFECDTCFKRFLTEKLLNHHKERPYRKRRFVCVSCGLGYFTNSALVRHENWCLGEEQKIPCNVCGKLFRGVISFSHHKKLHQENKKYACTVCGKTFKSKWAVPSHMVTHTTEQPYRCTICPAKFKRETTLINHEKRHANPRPHKCDLCNEYFNNFATRKYHRLTVHEGLDPYRCEECGISFRRHLRLKHHMERAHGIVSMAKNDDLSDNGN